MALTGQLSDMSLAELIEFFCNQRKTGRLKVDYHRGHGVFFIKNGEIVDAKVGTLNGVDAVYFALTLPNAAFDFSTDFEPTRRTISDAWTQVLLEGLRRLDEGLSPTEADAFGGDNFLDALDVELSPLMERARLAGERTSPHVNSGEARHAFAATAAAVAPTLTSTAEETESNRSGDNSKKKWMIMGTGACVVLACAVAAIPLSARFGKESGTIATVTASAPAPETGAAAPHAAASGDDPGASSVTTGESTPEMEAAPAPSVAARREREARERQARERDLRARRSEEMARKTEAPPKSSEAASTPAAATSGPKSVRVSVTYDGAGRVMQASVAGTSHGGEAYAATAVRVARGRRFPAGKAGSTVVTIPIN